MADEPNKKMDEMLKAYADERRKAPELYLHPATRRMLQGEVQRTFGDQRSRRSPWDRIRSFWPQIAFGGALCCFLGIAILSLRQPSQRESEGSIIERLEENGQLATPDSRSMNDRLTGSSAEQLSLEAVEQSSVKGESLAEVPQANATDSEQSQLGRERVTSLADPMPHLAPPELTRSVASAPSPARKVNLYSEESETLKRKAGEANVDATSQAPRTSLARSVAPSPREAKAESNVDLAATATVGDSFRDQTLAKEPAPAAGVESRYFRSGAERSGDGPTSVTTAGANLGLAGQGPVTRATQSPAIPTQSPAAEMTNLGAARRLHFVQTTNIPGTGLVPMFATFQFEQTGNDIRVLDRDGSVYQGVIQPGGGQSGIQNFGTVALQPVQGGLSRPTNAAEFELTVSGTNRTGNNVVLTGRLFERTNTGRSAIESFSLASPGRSAASARRPADTSEPRHFFIGNAIVGTTNQVPIRAVSREP